MTTATVNVRALRTRINRLVKASIEHSSMGRHDPSDWPYIESDLRDAERGLDDYLRRCTLAEEKS